jgi:hypothetical protein
LHACVARTATRPPVIIKAAALRRRYRKTSVNQ